MGGVADSVPAVRPAGVDDMPRVGALLVEGFSDTYRRIYGRRFGRAPAVMAHWYRQGLERGLLALFVAEVAGQVVGVLELSERRMRPGDSWEQLRVMLRELGPIDTARCVVGAVLVHEETARDLAYVTSVVVAPDFRSLGVGSALLARAEQWARKRAKRGLSLHVAAANPARRLYERLGFHLRKRTSEPLSRWLFGIPTWLYMVKPL